MTKNLPSRSALQRRLHTWRGYRRLGYALGVMCHRRQPAVLLLGPTGVGKSPVGDLLQQVGLCAKRVYHLDFGACLRSICSESGADFGLDRRERGVVASRLRSGTLLENEDFPIAAKILQRSLLSSGLTEDELVVLNGLPRHVGQAAAVDRIVDLRHVLYLACRVDQVVERILLNTGGDRGGRVDDNLEAMQRRLQLFERRTLPLLDYYRRRRVPVVEVEVGARSRPEEVVASIQHWLLAAIQGQR